MGTRQQQHGRQLPLPEDRVAGRRQRGSWQRAARPARHHKQWRSAGLPPAAASAAHDVHPAQARLLGLPIPKPLSMPADPVCPAPKSAPNIHVQHRNAQVFMMKTVSVQRQSHACKRRCTGFTRQSHTACQLSTNPGKKGPLRGLPGHDGLVWRKVLLQLQIVGLLQYIAQNLSPSRGTSSKHWNTSGRNTVRQTKSWAWHATTRWHLVWVYPAHKHADAVDEAHVCCIQQLLPVPLLFSVP